ncbi:uncharacterized protein LOC128366960 [Scomber japonicus]|uniref:uncharacterized protein LOC128366960 n=1 Tax=Scomber japonicus TaxID=13676 RepID=UPI002305ED1F|nr:uncharacterized protein LOC128366960 [Scomber japonicus]
MQLLAGAAAADVNYPEPVCAVRGSTVVLPCTFTPRSSFTQGGRQVPLKVIRVLWCVNHEICDDITSSVYDSASPTANPRYKYLGDMTGNCTLQISNIQMNDSTTFRFRMEADDRAGHYIDQSGVNVTVTDFVKMRIQSSIVAGELSQFQQVTLTCSTSICNIHQLEVTWFKDGNALPKSGPALQLGPLTAKDSGNYTCALKTDQRSTSLPFTVRVEEEDEGLNQDTWDKRMIIRVVLFTQNTFLIVIVTAVIIKSEFDVVLGFHPNSEGQRMPITTNSDRRFYVDQVNNHRHDIMLIHLPRRPDPALPTVTLPHPVTCSSPTPPFNNPYTLIGWSFTAVDKNSNQDLAVKLQCGKVNLDERCTGRDLTIDREDVNGDIIPFYVEEHLLCSIEEVPCNDCSKKPCEGCPGDSGGSLVKDDVLVGVTAGGPRKPFGETYFMDVCGYRQWIQTETGV